MKVGHTWTRYWAWWVAFGWLLGYEAWALATGGTTLSRMVWNAQLAWAPLVWVATGLIVVLWVHFWVRRR
ncbi:MAG: hypothetical protein OEW98_00260 [Betaproteobacteria bacterium]|nr:hypothetical protein [Betaproteobacteria bacterium]